MSTENPITNEVIHRQLIDNGYKLQQIIADLKDHKDKIEGAFPLDDRGHPNYSLHKTQHQELTREQEDMIEYKKAITLRLLQGGIGLIITIISIAIFPNLRELLSKI